MRDIMVWAQNLNLVMSTYIEFLMTPGWSADQMLQEPSFTLEDERSFHGG